MFYPKLSRFSFYPGPKVEGDSQADDHLVLDMMVVKTTIRYGSRCPIKTEQRNSCENKYIN